MIRLPKRFNKKWLLNDVTKCHIWQAAHDIKGYGMFRLDNWMQRAHRVAYACHNEVQLTAKDIIRHTCDTPACVNPAHLLLGTHQDNVNDKLARGRQPRGTTNYNSKLTEDQVFIIYTNHDLGTQTEIGKLFNVDFHTVSGIRRNVTWRHVTQNVIPI